MTGQTILGKGLWASPTREHLREGKDGKRGKEAWEGAAEAPKKKRTATAEPVTVVWASGG